MEKGNGIPHAERLFLNMNNWHSGRELMVVHSTVMYLASPYSHPDLDIRTRRYEAAVQIAAKLMTIGENVFSPIAHSHPITLALEALAGERRDEQKAFDRWSEFDFHMLCFSKEIVVVLLRDWSLSRGIMEECNYAHRNSLPVSYLHPADLDLDFGDLMPSEADVPYSLRRNPLFKTGEWRRQIS